MRQTPWTILVAIMLVFTAFVAPANAQTQNSVDSLSFTVFSDGYTLVEYSVLTDARNPTANVTIYGQTISDTIITDETGLSLKYTQTDSTLSVNSLGVEKIQVSYQTQDLTTKNGRFWSFNVTTTANATITLPAQASIVGFSQIPDLIDPSAEKTVILMQAGQIGITYVMGILGTQEYARIVLNDAQKTLNDIKALNLNVSNAEATLQEAWNQFNEGNFAQAETLANSARDQALQTNQTATQAMEAKSTAQTEIAKAQTEGRQTNLEQAQTLLETSQTAFQTGDYAQALSLASESANVAANSDGNTQNNSTAFPLLEAALIGSIAAAAMTTSLVFLYRIKKKKAAKAQAEKRKTTDIERIIKRNGLRDEEKEAVKLMAENNGEIMEAELYAKLNLPRTTTWRLVRRLEGMGIVEVQKSRRDNIVKLKK